ncbi:MAG TPA: PEGA domain-containing protein, partial [Acidobacteriota bacterium]
RQEEKIIATQSAGNGWISLNIQPWATIQSIKNVKGESISPPLPVTPCKFPIEEGSYEITLINAKYRPAVVRVEVKQNEIAVVNKKLEGFDTSAAIDSLGL